MLLAGMIYQYDATEGAGLIMLSDGETKSFDSSNWIDTLNEPSIGQKIAYESDTNTLKVEIPGEINIRKNVDEKNTPSSEAEEFTNIDDCIDHFIATGFKQVRDIMDDGVRTIILRSYTEDGPGEVTITHEGSKINVVNKLNEKPSMMR